MGHRMAHFSKALMPQEGGGRCSGAQLRFGGVTFISLISCKGKMWYKMTQSWFFLPFQSYKLRSTSNIAPDDIVVGNT